MNQCSKTNDLKRIDELISKTINKHNLINKDEKIVVGFSGGADSVMLLHYLKFKLNLNVFACHINHNLRGDESQSDMLFVKKICEEWVIPLQIIKKDVAMLAKNTGQSVEQAGRKLRYQSFSDLAKQNNAQKIATAHTLSDRAETMLFNLTRGTGVKGLCSIPTKRGNIIRPLSLLSRKDVEIYCKLNKLDFVIDSTNSKPIYTRNRIRHEVLPVLKSINPQLLNTISKTLETLNNEQEFLEIITTNCFNNVLIEQKTLDTLKLSKHHIALRYRVIAMFLEQCNIQKSNDLIANIDELIVTQKGKLNVQGSLFLEVKNKQLLFVDYKDKLDYFEIKIDLKKCLLNNKYKFLAPNGQNYYFLRYNIKDFEKMIKVNRKLFFLYLDYDTIIGKLFIRQRKTGDKISFYNKTGTSSIKKFFIDKKLTAVQKANTLIFCDEKSIIAVDGFGVDKRVASTEKTKNVLVISKKDLTARNSGGINDD